VTVTTRRQVIVTTPWFGIGLILGVTPMARGETTVAPRDPSSFPRTPPEEVREVVRLSHFDREAVRDLVEARSELAKASWDWGFGDWETAIGAASHTGRPDIVELLLHHGARPTLFTAAMMGWTDVVRSAVETAPGIQRGTGPHGITLLRHARAGGSAASEVVAYLESVGDADPAASPAVLDATASAAYAGVYRFGPTGRERLEVGTTADGVLEIGRVGDDSRPLVRVVEHEFHPVGAPSVRVEFRIGETGRASAVVVTDADRLVTAPRVDSSG
jgi:hypothetical protein